MSNHEATAGTDAPASERTSPATLAMEAAPRPVLSRDPGLIEYFERALEGRS
jgi:hypothetical protein